MSECKRLNQQTVAFGFRNDTRSWTVTVGFGQMKARTVPDERYTADTGVFVVFTKNEAIGPGERISTHPCEIGGSNLAILCARAEMSIEATNGKRTITKNLKPKNAGDGRYFRNVIFGVVERQASSFAASNQDAKLLSTLDSDEFDPLVEEDDIDLVVEWEE